MNFVGYIYLEQVLFYFFIFSPGVRPFVLEHSQGILHSSIHSFHEQSSYCCDTVIKVMAVII